MIKKSTVIGTLLQTAVLILSLFFVASTSVAVDETASTQLVTASQDNIDINYARAGSTEQFELATADGTPLEYKIITLKSPNRLVVDLLNVTVPRPKTVSVDSSNYVSTLRVGKHEASTRIVLDLASDKNISSQVDREGDRLVVKLSTDGAALADASTAGTDRPNFVPAAALPPEESAKEEAKVAKFDPSETETEKATTVSELKIESNGVVEAAVSSPTRVSMKKTAPSEYVVKIEGATLSDDATQAVIANSATNLIRSVRPVQEGSNVLLRIFAKPQTALEANLNDGKLIVASTNPFAADNSELRAQTAIDQLSAQAAGAAVESSAGSSAAPMINQVKKQAEAVAAAPEKKEAESTTTATTAAPSNTTGGSATGAGANGDDDIAKFLDDGPMYTGRLISLDLQDTDIDNALRIIAEVSNLNIIASDDVTGKVTLRLIDVPWDQALDVILKTNNLDKVQENNVIRIAPVEKLRAERESLKQAKQAEDALEPVKVKYLRVNYAKASEMKALLDSVVTERGAVTFDERTNQVIIKDIQRGLVAAAELISKLDMRTPQVLLETQIVEANRSLVRDLGSRLGFQYVQSPETGNATGYNFPNAVNVGAAISNGFSAGSNPISVLLSSADGTKSLSAAISASEAEGRARVVSRPSVATTNNKQASIKSVEKIRIRLPSGGVSVATGQGAQAQGQGSTATETIEVGIVLEVTPQASPDYFVLLDIDAKSSTLGPVRGSDGIPSEIERSATSSVLVSSGQTFALGGIYKITDNDNVGGLPFFKDIPFIGHLFRSSSVNNADEELLFFITPRIVEGSFDDAAMKASLN